MAHITDYSQIKKQDSLFGRNVPTHISNPAPSLLEKINNSIVSESAEHVGIGLQAAATLTTPVVVWLAIHGTTNQHSHVTRTSTGRERKTHFTHAAKTNQPNPLTQPHQHGALGEHLRCTS